MAEFNLAVLDLAAGRELLERVVSTEASLDHYQRGLLREVAKNPAILERGEIWTGLKKRMPIRDFLPLLLSKTSATLLTRYETIAKAARRFASAPDDYLEFAPPTMDTIWQRPSVSEPAGLVDEAMSRLEEREPSYRLIKADGDFVPAIREVMAQAAESAGSAFDDMEAPGPGAHSVHRVGYLNERMGFLVMAGGAGVMSMWSVGLRSALDSAFGGYPVSATPVDITYDLEGGALEVRLPRRDPATSHFEPFATRAVTRSYARGLAHEVTLLLGEGVRPTREPLLFEYGDGAARPGWPKFKGSLYRAEATVRLRRRADEIAGIIATAGRGLKNSVGVDLFLKGARELHDICDPDEAQIGKLAAELATGSRVDVIASGEGAEGIAVGLWRMLEGQEGSGGYDGPRSGGAAGGGETTADGGSSGGDIAGAMRAQARARDRAPASDAGAPQRAVHPASGSGSMIFTGMATGLPMAVPVGL